MTSTVIAGSRKSMSLGSEEAARLRLDITSYPTNGEPFTAATAGLESSAVPFVVSAIPCEPAEAQNKLVRLVHDRANGKLIAIVSSTGAEAANGLDLGEFEITVIADKQ